MSPTPPSTPAPASSSAKPPEPPPESPVAAQPPEYIAQPLPPAPPPSRAPQRPDWSHQSQQFPRPLPFSRKPHFSPCQPPKLSPAPQRGNLSLSNKLPLLIVPHSDAFCKEKTHVGTAPTVARCFEGPREIIDSEKMSGRYLDTFATCGSDTSL